MYYDHCSLPQSVCTFTSFFLVCFANAHSDFCYNGCLITDAKFVVDIRSACYQWSLLVNWNELFSYLVDLFIHVFLQKVGSLWASAPDGVWLPCIHGLRRSCTSAAGSSQLRPQLFDPFLQWWVLSHINLQCSWYLCLKTNTNSN